MSAVSVLEAQELIMDTFKEYSKALKQNKDNPSTPFFYSRNDLADLEGILANPRFPNELFDGLDAESYNYLLRQCSELADLYNLPNKRRLKGSLVLPKVGLQNKPIEKLMSQVRKFGDVQMVRRLSDIETGNGFIAFEEMDKYTEGYTKFENGQLKYCLNKKYEKITADEDLWRASMILAHELQRNPATGDLRGETAEIVIRDMLFVEHLASVHGEKVYEHLPEFELLKILQNNYGEEQLHKFIDIAFNHEGNYYSIKNQRRGRGITGFLLRLLIGRENYNRVFGDPVLDGFFDFSNRILHASIEFPALIISHGADIVRIIAISTGNLPLGAVATGVGTAADVVRLGSYALRAYDGDIEARNQFIRLSASMGVSFFVGWSVRQGTAHVRVIRSTKNGGFYQKGRRGRLTDVEGLHRMIMQELSPVIQGELAASITDSIIKNMLDEFGND